MDTVWKNTPGTGAVNAYEFPIIINADDDFPAGTIGKSDHGFHDIIQLVRNPPFEYQRPPFRAVNCFFDIHSSSRVMGRSVTNSWAGLTLTTACV